MKKFTNISDLFIESAQSFLNSLVDYVPYLIAATIIFILGWIIAKIVSIVIKKVLVAIKLDEATDKMGLNDQIEKVGIQLKPSGIIAKFIYYFLILLVVLSASDTLGWHAVSEQIKRLLGLLPNILIAVVIFFVGLFISTFIRDVVKGASKSLGISTGRILGNILFYFLMGVVLLTALEQTGLDTQILRSNMFMILGAVLIAGAISYGFASRDVLTNILSSYYSKNIYRVGMIIEVDGVQGTIKETNKIGIVLQTDDQGTVHIPSKLLISEKIKVLS